MKIKITDAQKHTHDYDMRCFTYVYCVKASSDDCDRGYDGYDGYDGYGEGAMCD